MHDDDIDDDDIDDDNDDDNDDDDNDNDNNHEHNDDNIDEDIDNDLSEIKIRYRTNRLCFKKQLEMVFSNYKLNWLWSKHYFFLFYRNLPRTSNQPIHISCVLLTRYAYLQKCFEEAIDLAYTYVWFANEPLWFSWT